ncbi:MAG: hypothetical protein U1E98_06415 [Moraxella osloensis]
MSQLPQVFDSLSHANIATLYLTPVDTQLLATRLGNLLSEKPDAIIILAFGRQCRMLNCIKTIITGEKQGRLVAVTTQCAYGGVSCCRSGAWLAQCEVLMMTINLTCDIGASALLIGSYDTPARRRQRWAHCLKDTHTVA